MRGVALRPSSWLPSGVAGSPAGLAAPSTCSGPVALRAADAAVGALGAGHETSFERLAFDDLWTGYSSGFYGALRSYRKAIAQVPPLDGRRYADFFVGTTIPEVKSGRLDQNPYLTELVDPLIGYALLAHFDNQPVAHVAVYAIRYQRLLRFRIEPLLNKLAGRQLDLDQAGADFAELLRDHRRNTTA